VGETLSTPEIAHAIGHHHGKTKAEKHAERIEILEAILLAVVAVATAWSGYQTGRWDGRQAHLYGLANKEHAGQNRAAALSGQQRLYDTSTFGFWLQEASVGHREAAALFERRFRPEYGVAFDAWIKTDPLHNPRAPAGPIFMPQYRNALVDRGGRQDEHATEIFEQAADARETGDKYVRTTVLLATVLFLIAVSQRFDVFRLRIGLLVVALVLLVVALVSIAEYPRL
jgi:hypothetical protein